VLAAVDRSVVTANRFVIAALLAIMTLLVFGNVVLRYGFGSSLPWVEEATRYMMIWTAHLGGGLAFRAGSHVAVAVLQDGLRTALRWVVLGVAVLFLAAVAYLGARYAAFAWRQRSPVLGAPFGLVYLAILVSAALMVAHLALGAGRIVAKDYEPVAGGVPAVE
jgi:TRAP-type C4-dicarboxylate transport system permease small subunit